MEVIRKKICLEKSRSRQQGLLPYIPFNDKSGVIKVTEDNRDGNFGGFVLNPDSGTNYMSMIKEYNTIMHLLHNGIRLKKIIKDGKVGWTEFFNEKRSIYNYFVVDASYFYQDKNGLYRTFSGIDTKNEEYINAIANYEYFNRYEDSGFTLCRQVDEYIGKLWVDKELGIEGSEVPEFFYLCDIQGWLDWFELNEHNEDCCIKKKWKDRGGDKMFEFLKAHKNDYSNAVDNINRDLGKYSIPEITIPLMLMQRLSTEGIGVEYRDDEGEYSFSGMTAEETYSSGGTVESRLIELRIPRYFYDDEGNALPGIFESFSDNSDEAAFFVKTTDDWSRVVDVPSDANYEVVTVEDAMPDDASVGSYCMVRYRNSEAYPMKIPFAINMPFNSRQVECECQDGDVVKNEFVGDFILSATTNEDTITFIYVFGGRYKYGENGFEYTDGTGVVYKESHQYHERIPIKATLDTKEVTIYCNYIDFEASKVSVHSDIYNMDRRCNLATILRMPLNDTWQPIDEPGCCKVYIADITPIIKPEFLLGFNNEVVIDADAIAFSRGNAAAFESHYKLTECNTLEDLVNYGNNYFNI